MTSPPRSMLMARLSLVGFLLYWAVLALLTHYPFPASESEGPKIDKPLHHIAFMLLTLAACWAVGTRRKVDWVGLLAIGACVVGYGVVDELTQAFIPRRTPALDDWLADLVGVSFGIAGWWVIPPAWKAALGDVRAREAIAKDPRLTDEAEDAAS